MEKVRILGPRARLGEVLATLQDVEVVHLCDPESRVHPVSLDARQQRHVRQLRAAREDAEEAVARLGPPARRPQDRDPGALPAHVRRLRRLRRAVDRLAAREARLQDERERLVRARRVLQALAALGPLPETSRTRTLYLVLSGGDEGASRIRVALQRLAGDRFTLATARLASGETAAAAVIPESAAEELDAKLAEEGVRERPLPASLAGHRLPEATRLAGAERARIDRALDALRRERQGLREREGAALQRARAAVNDALMALDAVARAGETTRAFVLEGWLPARELPGVRRLLQRRHGDGVVLEVLAREVWEGQPAPVVLTNPRVFRPFETITRMMPLPSYGSIDPTPFVAVFFPMFFGLMLGDVGYGALLGALALLGWRRSAPEGLLRPLSQIALACALFTVGFGVLYGELFGDLGQHRLGMRPLILSREEAFIPFLMLAVALGFVHVLLGLVLGALASLRGAPRHSLTRGLAAVMLVLVAGALLALVEVLPSAFFTPLAVALLVAFPVLIVLEGVLGAVEWLSMLANVLSYARIMALGTASVMLAVVANEMVGAAGGAVVGGLFALLFHLVNFALGVFSPTIHALRLHYVEFFGKFYSPGGAVYQPLRHWRPHGPASAT